MKRRILISLISLTASALAQEPFTYETNDRLLSAADFNNDGRVDAVIVDRADGVVRTAFQLAAGDFAWNEPQSCGIESPEALAVGRFFTPAADAFVVGSRAANRIHLIAHGSAAEYFNPQAIFPGAPGPTSLAALDIDGAGNVDVLAVCEGLAPLPAANRGVGKVYEAITGIGATITPLWSTNYSGVTTRVGRVRVKSGVDPRVGEIYQSSAASAAAAFYVEVPGTSGVSGGISLSGLTRDHRFTWTSLDGGALQHFLFWAEGSASLSAARATEPSAGVYGFSALVSWPMGKGIRLVVPAPQGSTGRLVILFTDGTAAIYDANGSTAPVLRQALDAGTDAVIPLGNGDFLTAVNLRGQTPAWKRWHWTGSAYAATQSGNLPVQRAASAYSNLIFLSAEPFVNPGAIPRSIRHVREWTAAPVKGAGLTWDFSALSFGTSTTGLTGPLSVTLSGTTASDFALTNQYSPALSLSVPESRHGPQPVDVIFNPPPGTYAPANAPLLNGQPAPAGIPAVTVQIAPTENGFTTYYRTSPTADFVAGPPQGRINLTATATIQAYARRSDGVRSPMRSGTWTISAPGALTQPGSADSDADGMADVWEALFNVTSPTADADGDGANNLAEYQGGTDPGNSTSVPAVMPVLNAASTGPGQIQLSWQTQSGVILQQSNDLVTWGQVTSGIEVNGATSSYTVSAVPPAAPARYFRLKR